MRIGANFFALEAEAPHQRRQRLRNQLKLDPTPRRHEAAGAGSASIGSEDRRLLELPQRVGVLRARAGTGTSARPRRETLTRSGMYRRVIDGSMCWSTGRQ